MPDDAQTVSIRKMPSAVWWDLRVLAAERRISVQDLVVEILHGYLHETSVATEDEGGR